jgi:hypothetical protein
MQRREVSPRSIVVGRRISWKRKCARSSAGVDGGVGENRRSSCGLAGSGVGRAILDGIAAGKRREGTRHDLIDVGSLEQKGSDRLFQRESQILPSCR